jgi:hypothetical protein
MSEPVKMMETVISLDYERPTTKVGREYAKAIREKRLLGHKCPECGRVYLPPRGYCPLCVVVTGDEHVVEVPARGVLVTFTIVQPDPKLTGGVAQERHARGTVMLDGTVIGQMGEIKGVPFEDLHTGMRMGAVWSDKPGDESGFGWGIAGIRHWEPLDEPDASPEEVREILAKANQ